MFGRLIPREGRFFDLFSAHAAQIVRGSHALVQLMNDIENAAVHAEHIDHAERDADKITHDTVTLLHKTFITPIDRDQIHKLITNLDDILDLIQDCAESVVQFDIRSAPPEAQQLARICEMCCDRVQATVDLLANLKQAEAILKACEEIDRLESDADRVLRTAMSRLFREESDVKQLIKLRSIYLLLEEVTDRCEDVANVIEGIVMEHS